MKNLAHICQPLQAAVHTGRMTIDSAIEAAYRYGLEEKARLGLTVDHVVAAEEARQAAPAEAVAPAEKLVDLVEATDAGVSEPDTAAGGPTKTKRRFPFK